LLVSFSLSLSINRIRPTSSASWFPAPVCASVSGVFPARTDAASSVFEAAGVEEALVFGDSA